MTRAARSARRCSFGTVVYNSRESSAWSTLITVRVSVRKTVRQLCAHAGLKFETLPDEQMLPRVAELLAGGAIVGWFQGRMEFGPRALGNRSFLADPRRSDMRELLNKKVKLREWFRPLAPSMLKEAALDLFGHPHYDPFMITVLNVLDEKRANIPAVVHVDGTARPQTVSRHINPRYWGVD